jgi:hypothetical protein
MNSEIKPLTLAELCEQEVLDSETVLATFKEYALTGAAINPRSIREITEKTTFTPAQLKEAHGYMMLGKYNQQKMQESRSAVEYDQAAFYLSTKLSK